MKKGVSSRRVPFRNLLLRSLAVGGVLTIALITPNMTRFLKALDRPATNRKRLYARIAQGLVRLEHDGLVEVSGTYANRRVTMTSKGKALMKKIEFESYHIPEPAFWDGKWRVLAFDLTERRRRIRDQLRRLLLGAGFVRLQDSVWIYPYACDEFVSLLRVHLRSGTGEMRYFVAEALESDRALRAHFHLA